MMNSRRTRPAADVAVGYAVDERGQGIAYASISNGRTTASVRLGFWARPLAGLGGLEHGYAALAAVGTHLRARGFGRVRLRLLDERVVSDLSGAGSPPKSLAMEYVRIRCILHSFDSVRLEVSETGDIRDLAARARAEVGLHVAA